VTGRLTTARLKAPRAGVDGAAKGRLIDLTLRRSTSAVVIAAVLLVGGAVGGVGFLLGRDAPEPVDVSQATAAAPAHDLADARKAGYRRGFAAAGRAAEPKRTYAEGYERGYDEGAGDALGGAGVELAPATFYIVQLAAADGGAGLRLSEAHPLAPGVSYELCNTNDLCQRAPAGP
jgi:hypothetical protein